MNNFIGIDLGTSSVKLILVDEAGKIIHSVTKDYPLFMPQQGWSEQNPSDWWNAIKTGIKELTSQLDPSCICGIGCGGQMHGLVALDLNDNVIRPAILWNDGRTSSEVDYLNEKIGREKLSSLTANIAFAGFTAPKLLWLRRNEPENFARIAKIMLPKDYVNYMLTGIHCCDYSDASGMLLLNVKAKRWSDEMMNICGINTAQMPELYESYEVVGTLKPDIAHELGLPESVKVVAGAGDNAAAAVGTGTVKNGECNISIGTSGTIFMASESFRVDHNNALHSFAHANGKFHLMGCMLSAASCNKWFCSDILGTSDYISEQSAIIDDKLGRNSVFFLPYLMGERSPLNDTDARGCFIGLSMNNSRADLIQAVLEGVAFAIRDNFEVGKSLGINIERSKLCGGGARSPVWQKIISNVLNIPLEIPTVEEGPAYGGAMLTMVGHGQYDNVETCAQALVSTRDTITPQPQIAALYEAQYHKFRTLYPALRDVFPKLR